MGESESAMLDSWFSGENKRTWWSNQLENILNPLVCLVDTSWVTCKYNIFACSSIN